ncbi:acylphosphatase [Salana multivorans]|uniref:acylphosphatase n=1 Tax=Salana multivorans TaxID=120377 RepID=A0A3N2DA45_9MICO|nr:acylphosphatase [Salana multivorans]MBN8880916.1 acylphosphatase [Salana multivorans]ROR96593.1 acylphosphatase [Salana multivorans]
MRRVHVIITGHVQGVGFRWGTRQEALSLGLTGWVCNLDDGSVEAEAEGPPGAVEDLLAWLRVGPRFSRVTDVAVQEVEPAGDTGFALR